MRSSQKHHSSLEEFSLTARSYLTGAYMQESPEGGRFKKEIVIDGSSYLLLIRDEGGPPELQVGVLRLLRVSC